MNWSDLSVEVVAVQGTCPVYKVGDRFVLAEGYRIACRDSCDICLHSLGALMTFAVALSAGILPTDCGLAGPDQEPAHVRCLDPGPPLTPGGTVTFAIRRVPHGAGE
jgi:hypothetical protein